MRVFNWNVQSRIQTTLGRQIDAVLERRPDVVALQEVTLENHDDWYQGLDQAGYFVLSARELVLVPYPPPPYESPPFPPRRIPTRQLRRTCFNLTAAKSDLRELSGLSFPDSEEARFAFPEKHLAVEFDLDGVTVEIHNTHLPHGSGRGQIKVHAFEAIRRRIDEAAGRPTILCGDFNAPGIEDHDGPVVVGDPGDRWNKAEIALISNPTMRDVYRDVHDPEQPLPVSHFTGRRAPLTPHRYDYIFASSEWKTISCEYLSAWLKRDEANWRLSDHAPVEAVLELAS